MLKGFRMLRAAAARGRRPSQVDLGAHQCFGLALQHAGGEPRRIVRQPRGFPAGLPDASAAYRPAGSRPAGCSSLSISVTLQPPWSLVGSFKNE